LKISYDLLLLFPFLSKLLIIVEKANYVLGNRAYLETFFCIVLKVEEVLVLANVFLVALHNADKCS